MCLFLSSTTDVSCLTVHVCTFCVFSIIIFLLVATRGKHRRLHVVPFNHFNWLIRILQVSRKKKKAKRRAGVCVWAFFCFRIKSLVNAISSSSSWSRTNGDWLNEKRERSIAIVYLFLRVKSKDLLVRHFWFLFNIFLLFRLVVAVVFSLVLLFRWSRRRSRTSMWARDSIFDLELIYCELVCCWIEFSCILCEWKWYKRRLTVPSCNYMCCCCFEEATMWTRRVSCSIKCKRASAQSPSNSQCLHFECVIRWIVVWFFSNFSLSFAVTTEFMRAYCCIWHMPIIWS